MPASAKHDAATTIVVVEAATDVIRDVAGTFAALMRHVHHDPSLMMGLGWSLIGRVITTMDRVAPDTLLQERRDAIARIGQEVLAELSYCQEDSIKSMDARLEEEGHGN